jgi:hypothetical protein
MSIETCYAILPNKLFLAYDQSIGCADTDDPADFAAVLPCTVTRKDRSSVTVVVPAVLDPAMLYQRHCLVIGKNMTIRRPATIQDIELLGSSSVITAAFSR